MDLSNYQLNRVEENQWFNDQFFTKYTYPFNLKLTDEINSFFGVISELNIDNTRTYYKGYLFILGGHEEAVLEVIEQFGEQARVEIRSGFEEFPNFDKKLAELPLEKNTLGESLFDHAEGVITQTWPAVNYNFVQVHTDSFDPTTERWNGFENIINNRKNGAFLLNEFDVGANETYNRNIMIPLPYWMHVLEQGFNDAGYELKGDVTTDTDLMKMLFFRETEEYVNARIEGEEIDHKSDEYLNTYSQRYTFGFLSLGSITTTLGKYEFNYSFPKKGRYKVSGNIYLRRENAEAEAKIIFKQRELWRKYEGLLRHGFSEKVKTVDLIIDVDDVAEQLTIKSDQIIYGMINDAVESQATIVDLTITPLAIYDVNGDLIPPIITTSKIDLTKCVPTTTFGEFVKVVKNWKNMDLIIKGNEVHMNYIEPQLNVDEAVDLNQFNIEKPRRKHSQGNSFLLKFKDIESDDYKPSGVFVDIDAVQIDNFKKSDKTTEIVVDAIPLPIVFRDGISTALAVDKGDSNICVVVYEGAALLDNFAQDNVGILMPATYEGHWSKWIPFRIKSQSFESVFRAYEHQIRGLSTSSKVLMYNNYHLIKTLSRTNIPGKDIYEVELELESLK